MIEHDELRGEAFYEVTRLFEAWTKPEAKWPEGTDFEGPVSKRGSRIVCARLPNGHIYDLLFRDDQPDPRTVPPVLWTVMINERTLEVLAYPRIANMWCGTRARKRDDYSEEVWYGQGLGLERQYLVGKLSRRLRERTRTITEGWEF